MDQSQKSRKTQWLILSIFLTLALSIFLSNDLFAKTAKEIDASVDVAIERFYAQVEGSEALAKTSNGMLVMPNVVKYSL